MRLRERPTLPGGDVVPGEFRVGPSGDAVAGETPEHLARGLTRTEARGTPRPGERG